MKLKFPVMTTRRVVLIVAAIVVVIYIFDKIEVALCESDYQAVAVPSSAESSHERLMRHDGSYQIELGFRLYADPESYGMDRDTADRVVYIYSFRPKTYIIRGEFLRSYSVFVDDFGVIIAKYRHPSTWDKK